MSFIKSLFRCCSPTKRTKQYDIVLENEKNNNISLGDGKIEDSNILSTYKGSTRPKIILSEEGSAIFGPSPNGSRRDKSKEPEYIPVESRQPLRVKIEECKKLYMVDVVGNMLYQRKQEITVKGIKKKDNSLFFDEDDGNSIKTKNLFWFKNTQSHINVLDFGNRKDFILNFCPDYLSNISNDYLFLIAFIQDINFYKIKFNDSIPKHMLTKNIFIKLLANAPQVLLDNTILTLENLQFDIKIISKNIIKIKLLKNKKEWIFNGMMKKEFTIGKNEQCDISLGNEMLLSDFHTTIYYDKNLNIWLIKDGYKDEESSTGSWIFSTNPIFIISGMTIRMWNKEIKLFYE